MDKEWRKCYRFLTTSAASGMDVGGAAGMCHCPPLPGLGGGVLCTILLHKPPSHIRATSAFSHELFQPPLLGPCFWDDSNYKLSIVAEIVSSLKTMTKISMNIWEFCHSATGGHFAFVSHVFYQLIEKSLFPLLESYKRSH